LVVPQPTTSLCRQLHARLSHSHACTTFVILPIFSFAAEDKPRTPTAQRPSSTPSRSSQQEIKEPKFSNSCAATYLAGRSHVYGLTPHPENYAGITTLQLSLLTILLVDASNAPDCQLIALNHFAGRTKEICDVLPASSATQSTSKQLSW
jgi:hypothetical protein